MAYITQQDKARLLPGIKSVMDRYGMRGSVAIQHHSALIVTITSGRIDYTNPFGNRRYIHVTRPEERYTGDHYNFIKEMLDAMNGTGTDQVNHDKSDYQSDWFDIGWYVDLYIGTYNKPYVLK